jgi:hypothetical protein
MGSVFGPVRFLLPVCRFCWFLYTFNIHLYMHIFRRIFLSNYWNVYKNQQSRQTGSRNPMGSKTLPTIYGVPIWSLWPNIRFLPSIVAEKNVTKNGAYMFNVYKNQLSPRSPKGEGGILFYLCPSVQDIFRRIFLSKCWWQKSDIWSQASYVTNQKQELPLAAMFVNGSELN